MKKFFRAGTVLITGVAILLTLSLCVPVFADDNEANLKKKKGSVSVTLTDQVEGDKAVAGAELILYRVGNIKEGEVNQIFVPTPEFEGGGPDISDLNAKGLAVRLADYALANKISGTTRETDAAGFVLFDGLDAGLCLIMQKTGAPGYYPITPFLVSVPMTSQDGTKWIYDVNASPKVEPVPITPTPPPPVTPAPPPLIQTGQLNWPVPVLAVAGIIFFALGWSLTYLRGRKNSGK